MSQEDVETLHGIYDAMSRQDWGPIIRVVAPAFELRWRGKRARIDLETPSGFENVRSFFNDLWAAFDEVVYEPQEFFDCGDRIVALMLTRFTPHGSGTAVEIRTGHVWTFRDGMAIRCDAFPDREQALKAVGLSE